MSDYRQLDIKMEKQLRVLAAFQKKKRALLIQTATRKAVIRLNQTISPLLDDASRDDALLLSKLANFSAIAYRQLSYIPGALRFCDFRISKALDVLRG